MEQRHLPPNKVLHFSSPYEWFYEELQDLELTHKKDVLFIIGDWNAKVRSQETPGVTGKFGLGVQNEAGWRLTNFFQENSLVIANTLFQQHKRRLPWTLPDDQHQNQIDYILCSQRWRSSIQSAKTRMGADYCSDYELIAKFRLKLKKVGKTTRPFKHDLHQILYDYTVEVTNRFKWFDVTECWKNYGWRFITLYRRWWSKPYPRKRNVKMQNGCLKRSYKYLKREVKGKGNLYLSDSLQFHDLVAHKALLSVGFPSQEYWSGFPFTSARYLPDSGI